MVFAPVPREVLVLTDDVSIRNLFYLMRKLAAEDPANGGERAMAAIVERGEYDAVILDMRCPDEQRRDDVHGVGKIQASMMGRMLTIIAEVDGPQIPALVERYLFSGLPGAHFGLFVPRFPSPRESRPC
jgi:DNA-binding NtrC family response regulator